jgi:hypothetical protein
MSPFTSSSSSSLLHAQHYRPRPHVPGWLLRVWHWL